jgi:ergothioneine biosynthesis protein EgtB
MLRSELVDHFLRVRRTSEDICQPLDVEDLVPQPITDVSPPKWHLGHTSWFFEAMFLDKHLADYQPFHPEYAFVFNSYYESLGERIERPLRGSLSRPTVEEILAYRKAITERMCELIETVEEDKWSDFSELLVLALNHEQQHQELLITDIKFILANNPLRPTYSKEVAERLDRRARPKATKPGSTKCPGGVFEIGHQGGGFAYDNEGPVHKVYLDEFLIQNRLVTNGEYLQFIEDGGYEDFRFWLSDAWEIICNQGWNAPLYWEKTDNRWRVFTLGGLRPLDPDAPVCHVSYYEADAFAQWVGKRLPTEAEWEVAARSKEVEASHANLLNSQALQPVPLNGNGAQTEGTPEQMIGDVWEWTGSAYLPYPGYRRISGPLGEYNGKFMINQMVLRGGSCATPEDHIRITYRNFFQPDKRWQFMGIRLAE